MEKKPRKKHIFVILQYTSGHLLAVLGLKIIVDDVRSILFMCVS